MKRRKGSTEGWVIGGILVLLIGGAILSPFIYLQQQRWWGKAIQDVETDIERGSKSYVEGTIRDLRDLKMRYYDARAEHRDAVKTMILHRSGELDRSRLPNDLREFIEDLENPNKPVDQFLIDLNKKE